MTDRIRSDSARSSRPRVEINFSRGGVASPIQKRNVNGPAPAAVPLSKTTS
jgi:hypothetical protein